MFIIVGIIFSVVGIVMIINFVRQIAGMRNCYEVDARIVDYREDVTVHRHNGSRTKIRIYTPIYEYVDFGETKRYTSKVGTSVLPAVGEETTLLLSTGGMVYEKGGAIASLVMGIVCIVFGVAAIALGFGHT